MADSVRNSPATTLPRPWEESKSFHDALYEWMDRAPWVVISAAMHVIVLLVLALVPWHVFDTPKTTAILAQLDPAIEEPFEDPPIEVPPEVIPEDPLEDPVLKDAEVSDHVETNNDQDFSESLGDPDHLSDASFENKFDNAVLGIGPGAGGPYGGRLGGREDLRTRGGAGTEPAVAIGLEWLARHQHEDGRWDSDGFHAHCPANDGCDGAGRSVHDVGVTGLVLLAFLGDGHTTTRGMHREVVTRGIHWLVKQQDESGLLGERIGKEFLYDHGIATLALNEAYLFSKNPLLRGPAQRATNFISRARNPYGAWRYEVPPDGDNDSSVTGWMVFALKSAQEAGLIVDEGAFEGARSWFDEVTDRTTGRVGYDSPGSRSSRVTGINDHYPTDSTECMTAVGLLSRFFLGETPKGQPAMVQHAELLLRALPEWDEDGLTNDAYYWYYGTYAMYQMGAHQSRYWKAWNGAMTLRPCCLRRNCSDRTMPQAGVRINLSARCGLALTGVDPRA